MTQEEDLLNAIMSKASNQGGNTLLSLESLGLILKDYLIPQMQAMLEQSNPSSVQQEWGTEGEAAKICGMSPERMRGYLTLWVREGRVIMSQPEDALGKKGRRRYSLIDVRACMEGKSHSQGVTRHE